MVVADPATTISYGGATMALSAVSGTAATLSQSASTLARTAREYRDANIRVNAVAPATVRTADNVASMADPKANLYRFHRDDSLHLRYPTA